MGDYCDGEVYANHPLFSETSSSTHKLQILLFYDDLEVVNPLGSHTKKHKIGESIDNPIIFELCCYLEFASGVGIIMCVY